MHKARNFLEDWSWSLKSIYVRPLKFFSGMKTSGGYAEPLKFAFMSEVIAAVVAFAYLFSGISKTINLPASMSAASNPLGVAGLLLMGAGLTALAIFVTGGLNYLFLKLFGGVGTYEGTVRVMGYLAALSILAALLSFHSVLVIAVSVYSVVLQIYAFQRVHKLSAPKAAIAVLLPILLMALLSYYAASAGLVAVA